MTSFEGRIVVIAGPSLPPANRPDDPIFDWRPPAAAGDAYRIADLKPKAVVLIDGLFDEQPSIRHKELLALLARGVFLIGGASMGALRGVELSPFGMIGVGRIFEGYASGLLIGDDEVALLHGPEDWGWNALTEPLVNVRATLLRALRRFVVDKRAARLVLNTAMRLFYKERTWSSIFAALEESNDPGAARARALADRLADVRVDLKRLDALACVDRARTLANLPAPERPFPPSTVFSDALFVRALRS
jgi:hypothetical protein